VNTLTLTRISLAAALCGAACANKDDGAAADGDGTTDGETTSDPSSDDSTGNGTTTDASAEGSGEEESTGEPTEAVYAGDVYDFLLETGIPGAAIRSYETPDVQTVSDANGDYEIGPLPLDPPPIFVLEPSEDYLGSVRPTRTEESPNSVRLAQVSREVIDGQIELLQPQEPAEVDLEQSVIIVRLLNAQATGTVIEMDPPPEPDTYYAPDANFNPVLNLNEIQLSLLPVVVYFNVAPADPHTYVFTATHPTRECTVERPDFPTLPGHITLVEVSCPVPPPPSDVTCRGSRWRSRGNPPAPDRACP
jgi:hypothetical protein